jgi:cytochrome P450
VQARISQRKEDNAGGKDFGNNYDEQIEGAPEDFLQKMMKANQEDPSKVTDHHVFMMGLANIIAGSDTTAVSLSAILYCLLRYPETMRKLRGEIEQLGAQSRCGSPNGRITFKQSQEMPYLQAEMKEALRMCSATGLPLWREVPPGGAEISGSFFPAGTVVGVNTWCSHYNESVFQDAKQFRPER